VLAGRTRLQRALLAVLLLSQGTPMLLAGDELGHSQQGNNNAYCQDNAITWLDWAGADGTLAPYVARLTALRREAPLLRRTAWWPETAGGPGAPGVRWLRPDGQPMAAADWAHGTALAIHFTPGDGASAWLVLVNAGAQATAFALPPGRWRARLASDPQQDGAADAPQPLDKEVQQNGSSLMIAST